MNCEQTEEQLVFFHLGEAKDRHAIESHLSECSECLRSYWFLKQNFEQSTNARNGPVPERILREKIRAVVLPVGRTVMWRPLAGIGAVAVALLVMVVWITPQINAPTKESPIDSRTRWDDVDSSRPEPATLHFL